MLGVDEFYENSHLSAIVDESGSLFSFYEVVRQIKRQQYYILKLCNMLLIRVPKGNIPLAHIVIGSVNNDVCYYNEIIVFKTEPLVM